MKVHCIVVDDKPLAIDILKEYIAKMPSLKLVLETQNPLVALDFLKSEHADIIFMDIQMPELNGIQFMKILNKRAKVILCTAYSEFALDGYEHDAIDYLLKPFSFERFCRAVNKAIGISEESRHDAGNSDSIFVKADYRIQRIALDDILFIEARENYIAFHTVSNLIMSLQNISSIEKKLPSEKFVRVHKSYIVALHKITLIEKSRITVRENILPIGDRYRANFFKRIDV